VEGPAGDLSTLTLRVAGAAVVNGVIGRCRPSSKGGVQVQVDQLGDYGTKRGLAANLRPCGVLTALQPGPRFQRIGDGDGDGGASPIRDKSGTGTTLKVPGPSPPPGQSGTGPGTGTVGTGVSAPWAKRPIPAYYLVRGCCPSRSVTLPHWCQ
jgi:hypothetical protein